MKRLLLILIILIANKSGFGQSNFSIISDSSMGIASDKITDTGETYYGNNHALNLYIKDGVEFKLSNKTFLNYKKITFIIQGVVDFDLSNCTFEGTTGNYPINFVYHEDSAINKNGVETQIALNNCNFNYNIETDKTLRVIDFHANDPTVFHKLKNVTITQCTANVVIDFDALDTFSDFNYGAIIQFYRDNEDIVYQNINITNNHFSYTSLNSTPFNLKTAGIRFSNKESTDMTGGSLNGLPSLGDAYISKDINISNNTLITESTAPQFGIFVQGPYKNVYIDSNNVNGFGFIIGPETAPHSEGAITLYGARPNTASSGSYYGNFENAYVRGNQIYTRCDGIRANGGKNITISNNNIVMLPLPDLPFGMTSYDADDRYGINCALGNYTSANYANNGIYIDSNILNCNSEMNSVGIRIHGTKNFKLTNNQVLNSTASGIVYNSKDDGSVLPYSDNGFISEINSNKVDFSQVNSLGTNMTGVNGFVNYLPDSQPLHAGILVVRYLPADQTYMDEKLVIDNNTIIKPATLTIDNIYWKEANTTGSFNLSSVTPGSEYSLLHNYVQTNNTKSPIWTPQKMAVGNYFENNYDDVCVTTTDNSLIVVPSRGTSFNNPKYYSRINIFETTNLVSIAPFKGRFNNDNRDDILIYAQYNSSNPNKLFVGLSDGKSFIKDKSIELGTSTIDQIAVGNFNGGTTEDEILVRYANNTYSIVALSNGVLSESGVSIINPSVISDMQTLIDFKAMKYGSIDRISFFYLTNQGKYKLVTGTYVSNSINLLSSNINVALDVRNMIIGDFTGDNYDDVCLRTSGNVYYVYPNAKTNYFGLRSTWSNNTIFWADGIHPSQLLSGKFNNDQTDDIYFLNLNNYGLYKLRAALSDVAAKNFTQYAGINFDQEIILEDDTRKIAKPESGDAQNLSYRLYNNFPNPFNPATLIKYQIPEAGYVSLKVYDVLGREVATLVHTHQTKGTYEVQFNASHLSSGVYIYRIEAGNFVSVNKMLLLK